jgi:hypothetical protein
MPPRADLSVVLLKAAWWHFIELGVSFRASISSIPHTENDEISFAKQSSSADQSGRRNKSFGFIWAALAFSSCGVVTVSFYVGIGRSDKWRI